MLLGLFALRGSSIPILSNFKSITDTSVVSSVSLSLNKISFATTGIVKVDVVDLLKSTVHVIVCLPVSPFVVTVTFGSDQPSAIVIPVGNISVTICESFCNSRLVTVNT